MMYQDQEGKKRFVPEVQLLLTDQDTNNLLSMLKSEKLSSLVDCNGTTLLHLSAKYHNEFFVDYLIDENLDINPVDIFGETPLMSAIKNHVHTEVWKALLDAGADLWMIKNNSGQSALAMIIQEFRYCDIFDVIMNEIESRCFNIMEMVDALLNAEFQVYHLDIFKKSEITKGMLERGCPVNLIDPEDEQYNTALHVAARTDDLKNVKVLLQYGADKNIKNFDDYPPIVTAFYYNSNPNVELMQLLLPDDKDWLIKDDNMYTVFRKYSKVALQFLLQRCDVDLNARDSDGRSGLYHLMANKDVRIVWELLKNMRLDVNAIDKHGISILHQAINQNNVEAVKLLLERGANLNVLDKMGRSPLFCITGGTRYLTNINRNCTELLMKHGANAQIVDQYGKTVISHLVTDRDIYLFEPILSHLAIIEACGTELNTITLDQIEANDVTNTIFKKCKQDLDEMKTNRISGMVTYFKFLTDEDKKIVKYVQNDEIVENLSKYEVTSYLSRLLIERFERATEIGRWRKIVSQLIIESVEPLDGYYLIIEQILDFLDVTDVKLIAGTD